MYPFILCFCGRSIGDLYDAFSLMRIAKYSAAMADLNDDIDPLLLPLTELVQIDLVDIFEQLNIHMDCCRNHIQTQVEFKTLY